MLGPGPAAGGPAPGTVNTGAAPGGGALYPTGPGGPPTGPTGGTDGIGGGGKFAF